ncbi:MAG: prolipoprotein diacylglyceryl transferase [Anaerolineae bacterium]|nr:prolipoprotein diacylglyceryl transferase [Anaerolineae bacterium]
MNATDITELGPFAVRTYTAWLTSGILAALGLIAWRAYRRDPAVVTCWLDVGLAAIVGGIIGARLLHVLLEWDYFADHTGEITRLSMGGLAWHGALIMGIPAALLVARIRQVPLLPWTDALALGWPVGTITAWIACRGAGCAYGYEVNTLADWPGWLAGELPDVYGLIAPHLEIQAFGAAYGGVLFAVALLLTWKNWLPGVRFWLILALTSLGFAIIGFFRIDPAYTIHDRRADQVFDLVVLLLATMTGSVIWLWQCGTSEHHPAQDTVAHPELTD